MTGIALSLFFYSTVHVHYVLPDVTPPIMRLQYMFLLHGVVLGIMHFQFSVPYVPIIVTVKPSKLVLTITSIIIT